MSRNGNSRVQRILLSTVISSTILAATTLAQSKQETASLAIAATGADSLSNKISSSRPTGLTPHAKAFYMATLGVDSLALKAVESGLMIRFSYRVVTPEKAGALRDKKMNPYLVDERTHRALVIPTIEQVGELRQSGPVEAGEVYWMLFSNKGNFVKTGSRVSLVFGKLRIDGLVVE